MNFPFREVFLAGWPVFTFLMLCSVASLAVIFERYNYFRRRKIDIQNFCQKVVDKKEGDSLHFSEPLTVLVKFAWKNSQMNAEFLQMELQNLIRIQMMQAERFVPFLGTIAAVSPFVGLLGTVLGIIRAFQTLATTGAAGPQVVAGGISEALVATAMGLIVAIPALIAYNFFSTKIRRYHESLEICAAALVNQSTQKPS